MRARDRFSLRDFKRKTMAKTNNTNQTIQFLFLLLSGRGDSGFFSVWHAFDKHSLSYLTHTLLSLCVSPVTRTRAFSEEGDGKGKNGAFYRTRRGACGESALCGVVRARVEGTWQHAVDSVGRWECGLKTCGSWRARKWIFFVEKRIFVCGLFEAVALGCGYIACLYVV